MWLTRFSLRLKDTLQIGQLQLKKDEDEEADVEDVLDGEDVGLGIS